jgi:hypothetical protein
MGSTRTLGEVPVARSRPRLRYMRPLSPLSVSAPRHLIQARSLGGVGHPPESHDGLPTSPWGRATTSGPVECGA